MGKDSSLNKTMSGVAGLVALFGVTGVCGIGSGRFGVAETGSGHGCIVYSLITLPHLKKHP